MMSYYFLGILVRLWVQSFDKMQVRIEITHICFIEITVLMVEKKYIACSIALLYSLID